MPCCVQGGGGEPQGAEAPHLDELQLMPLHHGAVVAHDAEQRGDDVHAAVPHVAQGLGGAKSKSNQLRASDSAVSSG